MNCRRRQAPTAMGLTTRTFPFSLILFFAFSLSYGQVSVSEGRPNLQLRALPRIRAAPEAQRRQLFRRGIQKKLISPKNTRELRAAEEKVIRLQNKVIVQGCNLNACFGMDNSRSLGSLSYRKQAQFVGAVAAIAGLDPQFHAAAVQYGFPFRAVSGLTKDISTFIEKVERSPYRPAWATFVGGAIAFCDNELDNRVSGDANKITLIGDGRSNLLGTGLAAFLARQFLPPSGKGAICAVSVGKPNNKFWNKITMDPSRVIDIESYDKFFNIVDEVVNNICGLDKRF